MQSSISFAGAFLSYAAHFTVFAVWFAEELALLCWPTLRFTKG